MYIYIYTYIYIYIYDAYDDEFKGATVPYFWPYSVGIFPYRGLKNRPCIW